MSTYWSGDKTGRDPGNELDGLRRAVAETIGNDPETWPDHGNAPLAIAAHVVLDKIRLEEAEAELARLRSENERLRSVLAELVDTYFIAELTREADAGSAFDNAMLEARAFVYPLEEPPTTTE